MKTILEPARQIPVCWEGDICVLGGSCTGLFAAVRAARLGARVCVVEKQNCFGGMATAGLINIWHSLYDFDDQERVIAGLTLEVLERLAAQGQVEATRARATANRFNPVALIRQLDLLAQENGVHALLHTQYAGMLRQGDAIDCVFVQNKDGRSAIRAKIYIDATGDGDLMRDVGCERYMHPRMQPPSTCFLLQGNTSGELISWLISQHGAEFGLDDDWGWFGHVPGLPGISFRADNHVFGFDLSRAEDLTQAEFEGRRRAYAFEALLKRYASKDYGIVNMCSSIGIRETAHYATRYQANEKDLLEGARFADAILNGTYCVDIHHNHDNGITFKQLDGSMRTVYGKDTNVVEGNWRRDAGLDDNYSRYYQVPFSLLVQEICPNLIPAGRMIHADSGSFGALRVMVNTNQLGEAAGVAAYIAVEQNLPIQSVDGVAVRRLLAKGGSAL